MWPLQTGGFELSAGGTTQAQQLFALVVIGIGIVAVIYASYRSYYLGLPQVLERAKADLGGHRADATLRSAYLPADSADAATVRETVEDLLAGEYDPDPDVRTAGSRIGEELAATWAPYLTRIPRTARRVLGLALLGAVFGFLAVETDALIRAMQSDTTSVQPALWPVLVVQEPVAVLGRAGASLQGTPVLGTLWNLAVAVVLIVERWLYDHWFVGVGLLVAGAVALTYLDRQLDAYIEREMLDGLPEPTEAGRVAAAALVSLWIVTLFGVAAGRIAGAPNPDVPGEVWGLYAFWFGVGVLVVLTLVGIRRQWGTVRWLRRRWELADRTEQAYLLVRLGTLGAAVAVGVLVPIYIAVALTQTPRLVMAVLRASLLWQLLSVSVLGLIVFVLGYQAAAAWGDVRTALRISAARRQVRIAAGLVGISIPVVLVTYTLVAGLSNNIVLGAVAAAVAGVASHVTVRWLTRLKFRTRRSTGSSATGARRIVLEAATLEGDGQQFDYVRVNGSHDLLDEDRDAVADAAAEVATALVAAEDVPPTLPGRHADFAFDFGVTDPDETILKLHERVRRRVLTELREHGKVPDDHLAEQLEDIPDAVASVEGSDEWFGRAERRGIIRRRGDYIELRSDPYAR